MQKTKVKSASVVSLACSTLLFKVEVGAKQQAVYVCPPSTANGGLDPSSSTHTVLMTLGVYWVILYKKEFRK